MNQLVMFRVPTGRILDRSAYEYFTGLNADGSATWSSEIRDRGIVHTFPSGWVNVNNHPYAWQPSVTYNPGLGVYLMANWATPPTEDGFWFGGPSYLGLYQSSTPWGPWEQFYESTSWTPGGDENARCYQPQIIPNWISADGRSFWLVWTDWQHAFDRETRAARHEALLASGASDEELAQLTFEAMPYYGFNLQRVDLEI